MLPIFMTENINYTSEGVCSFGPCYQRTMVVVDGEALIGKAGQEVRWDLEIQRRLLIDKLLPAIGACGLIVPLDKRYLEDLAVLPIAMPANENGPGAWKALLINLPNLGGCIQVGRDQAFAEPFRERCEAFADRWQKTTRTGCGVLTGHTQLEHVESFFLNVIEQSQSRWSDDNLFKKSGDVFCETQLMSLDLHRLLKQAEPDLVQSARRKSILKLPAAVPATTPPRKARIP